MVIPRVTRKATNKHLLLSPPLEVADLNGNCNQGRKLAGKLLESDVFVALIGAANCGRFCDEIIIDRLSLYSLSFIRLEASTWEQISG